MRPKYYAGHGPRFYYYDSDPVRVCPIERYLHEGTPPGRTPVVAFGVEVDLALVLRRAHRTGQQLAADDDPSRCRGCGAQLQTLGYRSWVEEPWPSEQECVRELKRQAKADGWSDDELRAAIDTTRVNRNVAVRLGATHRTARSRVWRTKREAIEWARDSARAERDDARAAREVR